jgi:hypothetical protein
MHHLTPLHAPNPLLPEDGAEDPAAVRLPTTHFHPSTLP